MQGLAEPEIIVDENYDPFRRSGSVCDPSSHAPQRTPLVMGCQLSVRLDTPARHTLERKRLNLPGCYGQLLREPYQVSKGVSLHLPHDVSAVDPDRNLTGSKDAGCLLAQ